MQHALKHVERPGGSHKALDGKKDRTSVTTWRKPWRRWTEKKSILRGFHQELVRCVQTTSCCMCWNDWRTKRSQITLFDCNHTVMFNYKVLHYWLLQISEMYAKHDGKVCRVEQESADRKLTVQSRRLYLVPKWQFATTVFPTQTCLSGRL